MGVQSNDGDNCFVLFLFQIILSRSAQISAVVWKNVSDQGQIYMWSIWHVNWKAFMTGCPFLLGAILKTKMAVS